MNPKYKTRYDKYNRSEETNASAAAVVTPPNLEPTTFVVKMTAALSSKP